MQLAVRRKGHQAIVKVEGRLVRENQADLKAAIDGLVNDGVVGIALDFAEVEYVDSAGLGACASSNKMLRERGEGALVMFGGAPSIVKMWRMIRLDLVIPLFDSEKEALGWLQTR